MQLIGGGAGEGFTKVLGMLDITWQGFKEKTFTKIEAYAGIA